MTFRRTLVVITLTASTIAVCAVASAGTDHRTVSSTRRFSSASVVMAAAPYASDPTSAGIEAVNRLYQTVAFEDARLVEERAEAERAQSAANASVARRNDSIIQSSPVASGAHSDAWWRAVAICEQGGRNHPFFGYFSIMDGSAGGLDWGTQVGMANQIIARAGDAAWAASCVAAGYNASPGG